MKDLTNFLEDEGFYSINSKEKDEILELKEIKVDGSAKTFIYKDSKKKKSLFERIKDILTDDKTNNDS